MKKITTMLLILPAMILMINQANAQRRNTTSHDIKTVVQESKCECTKGEKCKCANSEMKAMKEKMLTKSNHDLDKKLAKVNKKIDNSSFSNEHKKLLKQQAKDNYDLAQKQNQAQQKQLENQRNERMKAGMGKTIKTDKDNKKVIKKINDLLENDD